MESKRSETPYKIRKTSTETKDSKTIFQNMNNITNNDLVKYKNIRLNRYSLFVKNIAKAKKFKSMEKRRKKDSIDEQEKKRQKKPTYMEKYKKYSKPKSTFYSTSKNPKINEIMRKLKESEEKSNTIENNNINIKKIDSNKIKRFLGSRGKMTNRNEEINIVEPKVKNYVDKLNKIMGESSKNEGRKKKQIIKTKNNVKEKEIINNKEHEESYSSYNSSDEYKEIRKDKKKSKKKDHIIQILKEDNCNTLYISGTVQEKYIKKPSSIAYTKFNFKSIKLIDKIYRQKEKSESKYYIPINQTSFTILSEIFKKNSKVNYFSNLVNNIKLHYTKNNKVKIKRKITSEDMNKSEGNENIKFYDIVGYDNKKRRMSIYEILKKRNISIISEEPFTNRTRNSRSIKLVRSDRNNIDSEKNNENENSEFQKYNKKMNNMTYSNDTYTKKFEIKDFQISRIENIELTNQEKPEEVAPKINNNVMIIKRENDIEIFGNIKRDSKIIPRNRNSLQDNENKPLINKRNSNKIESINRKSSNSNNKSKMIITNTNNLTINKNTLQEKIIPKKRESNSTERRQIKSSILLFSESSSNEEEEKEEKKSKEDLNKIKEIKKEGKKINHYDELLHHFATNYSKEKKPKRTSKNIIQENNSSVEKRKIMGKNNALKNEIKTYTDKEKEINESRALFKKRLKTSNKLLNEEKTFSKNPMHKIKTDKAKIKQFKSKNILESKNTDNVIKKNTNIINKKYTDKAAKIRQFHKQRNIHSDYLTNNNIILQNTTVNHTTYNYYLSSQRKLSSSTKKAENKK